MVYRKFIVFLLLVLVFSFGVYGIKDEGSSFHSDGSKYCWHKYDVREVNVQNVREYRFFCNQFHFMTIVDEMGTFNIRPHPGFDPNGWGSSWYAQPFLPGAELKYSNITQIYAESDGIYLQVEGLVSRGRTSSFGDWSGDYYFSYNPQKKEVYGLGNYSIELIRELDSSTGDLNLYRLASNYLDDVPLNSGGVGDTGDMNQSIAIGEGFNYLWIPPEAPGFFPQDHTNFLSVEVTGDLNEVDTRRMGFNYSIAEAYKPTIVVNLTSMSSGIPMIYGAVYDVEHSQEFWSDNVGITPLVLKESNDTEFNFAVEFFSKALKGDDRL